MDELQIGNMSIVVTKKNIKNMYIRVLPPNGKVQITAPHSAGDDAIRMFAASRISWIKKQRANFEAQARQTKRQYVTGETYAVLFDPRYKTRFVDAVLKNNEIKTVFIVTDAAERYRSLCAELPGCRVMQLYESYLRSFEINAIG